MTDINKILSRITILYYIFIVVLVADFAYSFGTGFLTGFEQGRQSAQAMIENDPYSLLYMAVWSLLTIVIYIWALVLFVILLVSLGRSIATKNIFNPKTFKHINRYAVVYASSLVMMFVSELIGSPAGLELHDLIMNLLSGASTIVMLLLFAQVLKIGNILKAETDLTI